MRLCVVRQALIVSGMARQVWYFLFRCAGACCVTNRRVAVRQVSWGMLRYGKKRCGLAGMVRLVAVRFVLEGRVSAVYERACCVLAGVVGCVGPLYGQARRVLVRLAPVSWGRFDPVRVARIGVAGRAGFVDFGLGAVR